MKPLLVLTTVGADFDCRVLARELVDAGHAACVSIVPAVTSVYRWEGRVVDDREQMLIIKTVDAALDALHGALAARHPYEVPEFIVIPIDEIRGPYREWLLQSVLLPAVKSRSEE